MQFELFKNMMRNFGVPFDVVDMYGEWHVVVGGSQDRGATVFVFEEDGGKFLRYETPLVDSCLTRRM